MEAKGVVVWQRGIGDGTSEGSRPAEAGHHKSTGWRTEIEYEARIPGRACTTR